MTGVRYERTPATTDLRRPYSITLGLRPGYGNEPETPIDAVEQEHARWMCERAAAELPFLTAVIHYATVSYAWPRPDTTPEHAIEPVLQLSGEVSVLYAARVSDDQAVDMLDELAGRLADVAGQQRVYVSYRDRTWALDRHELPPEDEQPAPEQ